MSRLVVDAHANLDFLGAKVRLCSSSPRYVTVLQPNADGAYTRRDPLGGVVDFIKAGSSLSQSAGNLVHDTRSSETSAMREAYE